MSATASRTRSAAAPARVPRGAAAAVERAERRATTPRPAAGSTAGLGPPVTSRLPGVDVARAIAIVGMIAVHVGPTDGAGVLGRLYASPFGRASLLFVLVAGVGITLLARSRRATPGRARVTLLWRASLLLPAGVLLQQLDHGVNVILQAYALLFVVAVVVLAWPSRWLLGLALTSALAGPLVYWWGQARAPATFVRDNGELSDTLPDVLHTLLLSGPYPAVTWIGPLLFGMWLGRQDLTDGRLQRRLMAIGASVAVAAVALAEVLAQVGGSAVEDPASPWHLTVATAHSQMPLWLWGSTAAAVGMFGLALWAVDALSRWRRPLHRPLVVTGQLALTVYVAHVVSLAVAPGTLRAETVGGGVAVVAVSVLVAVVVAVSWRWRFRRGPLERLLQPPRRLLQPPGGSLQRQ